MVKQHDVVCLIHIPCEYPDGREIDDETMNGFFEIFDRQFGGSSPLGIISGRWLDETGKTVVEPMQRVEVKVKRSEVDAFERIARHIGKQTKQKAIYVVINYQAQGKLLFPLDDENEQSAIG